MRYGTPILKEAWFQKEFMPYSHFIVYRSKAILAGLNERLTDHLSYLSRHALVSIAIHDIDKYLQCLIARFVKILTKNQEAIATDVLKQSKFFLGS